MAFPSPLLQTFLSFPLPSWHSQGRTKEHFSSGGGGRVEVHRPPSLHKIFRFISLRRRMASKISVLLLLGVWKEGLEAATMIRKDGLSCLRPSEGGMRHRQQGCCCFFSSGRRYSSNPRRTTDIAMEGEREREKERNFPFSLLSSCPGGLTSPPPPLPLFLPKAFIAAIMRMAYIHHGLRCLPSSSSCSIPDAI